LHIVLRSSCSGRFGLSGVFIFVNVQVMYFKAEEVPKTRFWSLFQRDEDGSAVTLRARAGMKKSTRLTRFAASTPLSNFFFF
jgi:hypothetical protein